MLLITGLEVATDIEVSARWLAIEATYGGYVVSLAAQAAAAAAPLHTALAIDVEFTGVLRPGPARIVTKIIHAGRSTTTIEARIEQGALRVFAVAKLVADDTAPRWRRHRDLDGMPSAEEVGWVPTPYGRLPWEDQVEVRRINDELHPDGTTCAWVRLASEPGEEPADISAFETASLLLDPLPSGVYGLVPAPANAPTVEFALHTLPINIRTHSWYFVTQRLLFGTADTLVEESALWDRAGDLMASARQVRRVVYG